MKQLITFALGILTGILSFYCFLKNYAPIEVGRANCYTDGHYKIRLQADMNLPGQDKKEYTSMGGQEFFTLTFDRWQPCNPAEYRTIETQPHYSWKFPNVREEEHFKGDSK